MCFRLRKNGNVSSEKVLWLRSPRTTSYDGVAEERHSQKYARSIWGSFRRILAVRV